MVAGVAAPAIRRRVFYPRARGGTKTLEKAMTKIKIVPLDLTNSSSGVSIAQGERKGISYIRISLTKAAQESLFGGPLTDSDAVALEVDDQVGRNHMLRMELAEPSDASAIPFRRGVRESIFLLVQPWCQLSPGKRPSKSMAVVSKENSNTCYCKLPEWARPPVSKSVRAGV